MPDKRTRAGQLNATTGRTYPPQLTEGHDIPPMLHVEDLIAEGHMTERARWIADAAVELFLRGGAVSAADAVTRAADIAIRAGEWDRHERLR